MAGAEHESLPEGGRQVVGGAERPGDVDDLEAGLLGAAPEADAALDLAGHVGAEHPLHQLDLAPGGDRALHDTSESGLRPDLLERSQVAAALDVGEQLAERLLVERVLKRAEPELGQLTLQLGQRGPVALLPAELHRLLRLGGPLGPLGPVELLLLAAEPPSLLQRAGDLLGALGYLARGLLDRTRGLGAQRVDEP